MTIVKVLHKFARLRDDGLDVFAQNVLNKLAANANFITPVPALAEVEAVLRSYQSALALSVNGSKEQTSFKKEKRAALENMLRDLAMYVQVTSRNNATVALSSGFDIRQPGTRVGVLAKPVNLKIGPGPNTGTLRLGVEKVYGASSYVFQYTDAPATETSIWITKASTARNIVIDQLIIGKAYALRIAAVGTDPTLVFSEVVTKFVA